MARRFRWFTPLGIAAVLLLAAPSLAGTSWTPAPGATSPVVGHEGTWNDGPPSIVRSGSALIAIFDTDVIGGKFAFDDSGRYVGVYALRSTDGGATWSRAVRINQDNKHAERGTIASTGSDVCVAYETQQKYYARHYVYTFDPSDPRYNYVRCSHDGGRSWEASLRLPGQTQNTRGDYLYLAASAGNFYVVVTNTQSGDIWLWRSTNGGRDWSRPSSVGSTTIRDTGANSYVGGYSGLPAVGATGSTVGVAWLTNAGTRNGALLARISHDNGRTWDRAETLAASGANAHGGYPNVNGADTRLAFTWTTSSAAVLRLYRTSTERWGANSVFARFPDDQPGVGSTLNKGGLGPVALLKPRTTTIGIVWTECNRTTKGICIDNYPQASDRNAEMQLLYRESNDNGGSWGRASRIDAPARKYVQLDWAWGVFVGNTPYAYYNAHNAAYGYYQMRLKVCSGC